MATFLNRRKSAFVRPSKVRHLYFQEAKADDCYTDLRVQHGTGGGGIRANAKFWAVTFAVDGGALGVIPHQQRGRMTQLPKLLRNGHRGGISDFEFDPFADNVVATGGEDASLCIWVTPEFGLEEDLEEPKIRLLGHKKKISTVRFHPTASDIVATCSADSSVVVWSLDGGRQAAKVQDSIGGPILDMSWNYNGSQFATSSFDQILRVFDARTAKSSLTSPGKLHLGTKGFRLCYLGNTGSLLTAGTDDKNQREFKIWDLRKMNEPVGVQGIDHGAGYLNPIYDEDLNLLYIYAKGDGSIRSYEIVKDAPYQHFVTEYKSSTTQKGLAILPKRICDVDKCEVARFYKLSTSAVTPISSFIPRKHGPGDVPEDLYPDTRAGRAAMEGEEFYCGTAVIDIRSRTNEKIMRYTNKNPVLMKMGVQTAEKATKSRPTSLVGKLQRRLSGHMGKFSVRLSQPKGMVDVPVPATNKESTNEKVEKDASQPLVPGRGTSTLGRRKSVPIVILKRDFKVAIERLEYLEALCRKHNIDFDENW